MKRTTKLLTFSALLLATLALSCQHARIRFDGCGGCREEKSDKTQIFKQTYWLWGLSPSSMEYDMNQICPGGVKEIHQYTSWDQGILENLTIGIYMPKTLAITCN